MVGRIKELLPVAQMSEIQAMAKLSSHQTKLRAVDREIIGLTTGQINLPLSCLDDEWHDASLIAGNFEKWQVWCANRLRSLQKEKAELNVQLGRLRQEVGVALGRRQVIEQLKVNEKANLAVAKMNRSYEP